MKKIILFCILLLAVQVGLVAQTPGDLDFSFNGTGYHVRTDSIDSRFEKVQLMPDGRIVAGGILEDSTGDRLYLDRFLPDGELDTAFGVGGRYVLTTMDASPSEWVVMDVQPDGKPVIGASVDYFGVGYTLVMRLDVDGRPDSTFGQNGYVLDPTSAHFASPMELDVRPSGKILLLGAGENALGMVMLLADGNRDNSYGANGLAWATWQGIEDFYPTSGKITAAGEAFVVMEESAWSPRYVVVGLDAECRLDSSFGLNGRLIVPQSHISGGPIALQTDVADRVYLAGVSADFSTGYYQTAVVRLQPSGVLDGTFGNGGLVRFALAGADLYAMALLEQVDGKMLVCGVKEGSSQTIFVGRLTSTGQADLGFGQSGLATPYIGGVYAEAKAMAQQADGRIVVAGVKNLQSQEGNAVVARLWAGTVIAGNDGPAAGPGIEAFPNPTAGMVKLRRDWEGEARVTVTDVSGRLVLALAWEAATLELDLAGVPNGSYVVSVAGEGRVANRRVVVLHP